MDKKSAALLIVSLLERAARDASLGTLSSIEQRALLLAVEALDPDAAAQANGIAPATDSSSQQPAPIPTAGDAKPIQTLPKVSLNLTSVRRSMPSNSTVLLCLDFGTAMSKAFASAGSDEYLELELGAAVGREGFALPSAVFISDDGKVYFGQEAIDQSEAAPPGRERLDSIKGWLTLRSGGDLDGQLGPNLNPHSKVKLSEADLLRLYFAYLTDAAGIALGKYRVDGKDVQRYVKRRFARPCWPDLAKSDWADRIMRTMLAEGQVIADTLSGQWKGGIEISVLKAVLEQVRSVEKLPAYLIDVSVPEPVAVAAGAISDSENLRDAFMVVDAGAGTTDFGLFVATHLPNGEPKVFQVPASIKGLMQAGDRIDGMLRMLIARKEAIDATAMGGKLVLAELSRRIRTMKEVLFTRGFVEYLLTDGTRGKIQLEEFLEDESVQKFAAQVEAGFKEALEAVDESYLKWLDLPGVRLNVILTGGSSQLPMISALGRGVIDVRGHKIVREYVSPSPPWLGDAPPDFVRIYPQLAVAIGGTAEELPATYEAPVKFAGGAGRSQYVAGRLQISGS